jgi:hypothetical protein
VLFKKYKMALQNKLKAFVRFDGSGRVIPSSLILQKSKPKVGNWKEINATECCNGIPSSTTTTTTFAGPTQFNKSYYLNGVDACNTTTFGNLVFYSASSSLSQGITIFQDPALTVPVTEQFVLVDNMSKFVVGENGLLYNFYCDNFRVSSVQSQVCNQTATQRVIGLNSLSLSTATTVYGDFASWGYYVSQDVYLGLNPGYAAYIYLSVTSATSAQITSSIIPCN